MTMTTIIRRRLTPSRRLFEALRIPHMFSAPASFLALPVESVFRNIKMNDFREKTLPDDVSVQGKQREHLTHKQYLLS
jgi:hypothetical protein